MATIAAERNVCSLHRYLAQMNDNRKLFSEENEDEPR